MGIPNQVERRLNYGDPQTRGRLSRLKRSNWPINCGIRTLHGGKEENRHDAQNGQNSQFPSHSAQDHRSVTSGLYLKHPSNLFMTIGHCPEGLVNAAVRSGWVGLAATLYRPPTILSVALLVTQCQVLFAESLSNGNRFGLITQADLA